MEIIFRPILHLILPPPANTDEWVMVTAGSTIYTRKPLSLLWDWIKEKTHSDIITISKELQITTEWMDTGISGTDLASGTYAIQVYSKKSPSPPSIWGEHFTGLLYWYSGYTNDTHYCEIPLHYSGHAANGQYLSLRTTHISGSGNNGTNYIRLQIKSTTAATSSDTVYFKFKLLIPN